MPMSDRPPDTFDWTRNTPVELRLPDPDSFLPQPWGRGSMGSRPAGPATAARPTTPSYPLNQYSNFNRGRPQGPPMDHQAPYGRDPMGNPEYAAHMGNIGLPWNGTQSRMPGANYNRQPPGLTQSLYNWINSPGANMQSFQNMFGNTPMMDTRALWDLGRSHQGGVGNLPIYDPSQQGGWYQQGGTGQWGYQPYGTGSQSYQQQAPSSMQGQYQAPGAGGWGFGGGGGGGYSSQYGNSAGYGGGGYGGRYAGLTPQMQTLMSYLQGSGGYGGGGYGGNQMNIPEPYGSMGPQWTGGGW